MYPLLKANGGIRQLISLKPISFESPAEAVDEGNPEEKEGGGSPSDEADETRDFEGDIDVDVKK